ncbi:hypothetical protein TNCV_3399241 [Trichonephila clavipes]|nr:hypothetical protein TNCV_3399241 [Trichonephila clavipes]
MEANHTDILRRWSLKNPCGRGILVVKVKDSWPTCYMFEPSTAEDPSCSGARHVKFDETHPVVVVWMLRYGVPVELTSSSLDHGSKLRGPLAKFLEYS